MTEPGFDPELSDFRSRVFETLRHIWAAAWYSPSRLYDEDPCFHVFELQVCARRASLPVHLTSFIVTVSARNPRRWAVCWAAVCVCEEELVTWKALPTPRKSDPLFLVNCRRKGTGQLKITAGPFPFVSVSRDRKEGSERESGNQRTTLHAFQYRCRRSLKNLNADHLVDGYDCIFVSVGILENMLLTACQAWLVACKQLDLLLLGFSLHPCPGLMHVGGRSEKATRTNQPGLMESNGGEWLSETGAQVLLRWAQTRRKGGRRPQTGLWEGTLAEWVPGLGDGRMLRRSERGKKNYRWVWSEQKNRGGGYKRQTEKCIWGPDTTCTLGKCFFFFILFSVT